MLMSAINNPVKESFYKKKLSYFKQYYTYFHTLFDPQIFQKTSNNNFQTTLPNTPLMF